MTRARPGRGRLAAAALSMLVATGAAHAQTNDLAACIAAAAVPPPNALARGVNLTDALTPSRPIAQVEQDLRMIRQAGLGHVRLPILPDQVLAWTGDGTADPARGRLDAVICAAIHQGLLVILDLHPDQALALRDGAGDDVVARLGAAWDRLAGRYAAIPPGAIMFEALNEPTLTDPRLWNRDLRRLLAHIRQAAPRHTVLLTGSPFGLAASLQSVTPVPDANVAYVFHFYSPLVFTHQGADWTNPVLRSVRGLAYPATARNEKMIQAVADPGLQPDLVRYRAKYSSAAAVQSEINLAARWAARSGVRLVATELGVFGAADARSRAAWLRDVTGTLEANGIGWTVWEYRGGFGIADDLSAACGPSGSIKLALHLCPDTPGAR